MSIVEDPYSACDEVLSDLPYVWAVLTCERKSDIVLRVPGRRVHLTGLISATAEGSDSITRLFDAGRLVSNRASDLRPVTRRVAE